MWYVVPAGQGWVEIRHAALRPVKVTHKVVIGDGVTHHINTFKGGTCRAVIRTLEFVSKTGRSAAVMKQIPEKEARLFIEEPKVK